MSNPDIKNEILTILKLFDAFCRRHEIRYFLAYGTLLGAVRHQGFIPWDDDIDVILTTEEYYKLRSLAEKDPYVDEAKRYRLMLPGDRNYCYSYIKLVDCKYLVREKNVADQYNIGLFVDVFRADYWPESKLAAWCQLKRARLLVKLNEVAIRGNLQSRKYRVMDKLLWPADIFYRVFGLRPEFFCRRLEQIGSGNKACKYMGNISSGSGKSSERMEASLFQEATELRFEDAEYPVPADYDAFLRSVYGDYWVLPEEAERIGHEYDIREVRNVF